MIIIYSNDVLLETFFEKSRWEQAINDGIDKEIRTDILDSLCKAQTRADLCRSMVSGEYKITPPHEARIPKDDGSFRTVYVNTPTDRIICSVINDMFFNLYPDMIHKNCLSYQKNIGCGKIVKDVSKHIKNLDMTDIGVKIDLSKYFDSVEIKYIDAVFDAIEEKSGESVILDIVRAYYHDNSVYDINKKLISKYSSLRQGCAIAAFLADAVLFDIDQTISKFDVSYYRYSDDILIIGNEWKQAYEKLSEMLRLKNLTLNPKKIEFLRKDKWFKFLGFNLKNDMISLSKSRIKTFQKEIIDRTVKSKCKTINSVIRNVNRYLYKGDGEHSWAQNVLSVINVPDDIAALNNFVMDAVRAGVTGKKDIGGLGVNVSQNNSCITRGKGRHVRMNKIKIPSLNDYKTLFCMRNAMTMSDSIYKTLTANM